MKFIYPGFSLISVRLFLVRLISQISLLTCCLMFVQASDLMAATITTEIDSLQKVLRTTNQPEGRIQTLFALGKAYYDKAELRKALETHRKLLELISRSGSKADSAKAFRSTGLVMMEMSWYDESLSYLMQAQQLYGEIGDSSKQATSLMNIGIVYDCIGNLPMSLSYYYHALKYFQQINDESGIANCKLNIGIVLTKQKKYQQACDCFLASAVIYAKKDNLPYLAASYINLGLAYKNQKNFAMAMHYLDKSYAIYEKLDDRYDICCYHLNMGELMLRMKKPAEAKVHLGKAKKLAEQMGTKDLIARAYEFLSDYYVHTKNYESAYKFLLKSGEIKDSLLNAETVKKISQIQFHYEIAKRESEKVQLVRQNLQKELQLTQRTKIVYFLCGLLLVIGILVLYLFSWNRLKNKANRELEIKNHLIESQKDELIKLNASKDKFLSILAHDIKNPLSAIIGISNILNSDYESLDEEERKSFIVDIYTSSTNLFEIINTLLNWSISQNGMISLQPRNFNIAGLCQNAIDKLYHIAKLKDITMVNEADPQLSVFADENMVISVVHNLLCNAIKYSNKGGLITIRAIDKKGEPEISVIDEGIGISAMNQKKLFRYDQAFRQKGTTGEIGTGIGLILCKDFVDRNSGRIWVESEELKGSIFKFTLPPAKNQQDKFQQQVASE